MHLLLTCAYICVCFVICFLSVTIKTLIKPRIKTKSPLNTPNHPEIHVLKLYQIVRGGQTFGGVGYLKQHIKLVSPNILVYMYGT